MAAPERVADKNGFPDIPGVEFRSIVGWHGYCVGKDGSVWSRRMRGTLQHGNLCRKWLRLKPHKSNKIHDRVTLSVDNKKRDVHVHTLVLEAFVGPKPEDMEACHFPDPDGSNNALSNLRWATHADNVQDCHIHGGYVSGEDHHAAKFDNETYKAIAERYASGENAKSLASEFGLNRTTVIRIAKRNGVSDALMIQRQANIKGTRFNRLIESEFGRRLLGGRP